MTMMKPSSSLGFLIAVCLTLSRGVVESFAPAVAVYPLLKKKSLAQTRNMVMSVEVLETVETLQATLPPPATAATGSTSLLSQLDAFWQTCPYTAAALVCGCKASAADFIAQHQIAGAAAATSTSTSTSTNTMDSSSSLAAAEDKSNHQLSIGRPSGHGTTAAASAVLPTAHHDLDIKRNVAFVLYGALYQGMVHEYVFNTLYPAWFGTGTEITVVAIKVLFNLFIQTTFLTLPVAYILKAIIMQDETEEDNSPLQCALDKYWQDIQHQHLLTKCFGLWGPVQCLTFSIVPEHYRVTFIAIVSFFWLILLSNISSTENTVATGTSGEE